MLKSLKLDGVGPVQNLSAFFGDRLNVLTGDNGLGKSFLLEVCFWALTGTWPAGRIALPEPNGKTEKPTIIYDFKAKTPHTKGPKTAGFDFHSQTWMRPKARSLVPGLVIYSAVDGSSVVWDPARNCGRDPTMSEKVVDEQPRAYQFSAQTLANSLTEDNRTLCNGLITDCVNWQYQRPRERPSATFNAATRGRPFIPPMPRPRLSELLPNPFDLLESVVNALSHPGEPMKLGTPRRVFVNDTRTFPTIDLPYGNVAFPHWAAGLKRVLSLAYLLVWSWAEHVQAAELRREQPTDQLVLIIDEVESHLHPKWQRTILPALLQVNRILHPALKIQVIAATHSPLVLASLEPSFNEETDRFFWFDLEDDQVFFRALLGPITETRSVG
jgi:AAA domain, putative AbiEii toxin, Type IV TA system/AAA domain